MLLVTTDEVTGRRLEMESGKFLLAKGVSFHVGAFMGNDGDRRTQIIFIAVGMSYFIVIFNILESCVILC